MYLDGVDYVLVFAGTPGLLRCFSERVVSVSHVALFLLGHPSWCTILTTAWGVQKMDNADKRTH